MKSVKISHDPQGDLVYLCAVRDPDALVIILSLLRRSSVIAYNPAKLTSKCNRNTRSVLDCDGDRDRPVPA